MMNHFDEILNFPTGYVFVAIDFSDKSRYIYDEVICPAVMDAGMRPIRSDEVLSKSDLVHPQIRQLIQNSRLVIADTSLERQSSYANVFLEIGMALAYERPLVILTQDEDVPFDIQPYRRIKYNSSENGKRLLKRNLTSVLLQSVNPPEAVLQKMLVLNDLPNHIVYGHAAPVHIDSVFPPVDANYQKRLGKISSEVAGVSQLTIALHKVGWSMGKDTIEVSPVNSHMMEDNSYLDGNIYVFGGPGANLFFNKTTELADSIYSNALNIQYENVEEGKKRYYVAKAGLKYPDNQYKLYDEKKDIGFLMRFPNPQNEDAVIVVAAGIRTYGTEGAIKLLTTSSLISKIDFWESLDKDKGFWAIVEVSYNDEMNQLDDVRVIAAEMLIKKEA